MSSSIHRGIAYSVLLYEHNEIKADLHLPKNSINNSSWVCTNRKKAEWVWKQQGGLKALLLTDLIVNIAFVRKAI